MNRPRRCRFHGYTFSVEFRIQLGIRLLLYRLCLQHLFRSCCQELQEKLLSRSPVSHWYDRLRLSPYHQVCLERPSLITCHNNGVTHLPKILWTYLVGSAIRTVEIINLNHIICVIFYNDYAKIKQMHHRNKYLTNTLKMIKNWI